MLLGREFPYTHEISNDWAVVIGLFSKSLEVGCF